MGFEGWCRDTFGGAGRVWKTLAAASLIVVLAAATSRAGDVSGQPANSLSVTNSVTIYCRRRLLQPPPEPTAAPPPPGGEESWLGGLHISGYASQTFGMWQNPTNLRAYTRSRNNLAVARSLLQIDENYRLNENNTFFARQWFVYEPPYSFNSANNSQYARRGPRELRPHDERLLQHLRAPRRVVGKQDRSVDHLRRQPDSGVGTIAGLPCR